jgi:hypothetical protein
MKARAEAWRDAPLYSGSEPLISREEVAGGRRAIELDWNSQLIERGMDPRGTDCRGVASKKVEEMARHKVMRVTARKEGYCRRNTCECCMLHPPAADGVGRGQWCSCRAVLDGLCKRCWLDYHGGRATWGSQYWGPK